MRDIFQIMRWSRKAQIQLAIPLINPDTARREDDKLRMVEHDFRAQAQITIGMHFQWAFRCLAALLQMLTDRKVCRIDEIHALGNDLEAQQYVFVSDAGCYRYFID